MFRMKSGLKGSSARSSVASMGWSGKGEVEPEVVGSVEEEGGGGLGLDLQDLMAQVRNWRVRSFMARGGPVTGGGFGEG